MLWLIIVLGVLAVALLAFRFIQFGLLLGSLALAILWIGDNGSAFVWFMILWAILFVVAVIASLTRTWALATVSGALAVVLMLVFGLGTTIDSMSRSMDDDVEEVTPSATPTASPTEEADEPKPAEAACSPEFVQVTGANELNRVDSDFETKFATATVDATNLSEVLRGLLLENMGNNAQRLAIWSSAMGLHEDPNDWSNLVEGDCLSEEGQRLYYQVEGALLAEGATFEVAEAPADGINSGVNDGTYVIDTAPGISGDRTAIKVTLSDGTVVWILVRCGNVVYPPTSPPPDVPPGETDEKSSNPDDYEYPDGKPPVGPPSGAPESTPRPVPTSQPGGRGVVDTPSNPPGSETGVQAPGATPAPTTPPPLPPVEDGANSPVPDDPAAPPEGGNAEEIPEPAGW